MLFEYLCMDKPLFDIELLVYTGVLVRFDFWIIYKKHCNAG